LIATAVAIGLLGVRSIAAGQAQPADFQREVEVPTLLTSLEEMRAIESRAQEAGACGLNAAVASHVDSVTFIDLLETEVWWRAY
jgi:hypothetical protein